LGHVTVSDLKRLYVVCPERAVMTSFNEIVKPIHIKVFNNNQKISTLEELRDSLVPRLISGRLRLPESLESLEVAALQ
jgi:type I restriction enzyme S subunit